MEKRKRAGSLDTFEVEIILNLLGRGKRNQDILGIINTVRRIDNKADTNGGRISDVKTGKPRYVGIKPASNEKTDAFIARAKNPAAFSKIDPLDDGPTCLRELNKLLPVKTKTPLALNITETDHIECKESFDIPIKTVAAFANNKGGYFVFGVRNKTWAVVGLKDKKFENFDWSKFNQSIRSNLGLDLTLTPCSYSIESATVGILHVAPAHTKPVIVIKGSGDMAEGHIFYRYMGEDRLIAPADLQKILEDRLRNLSETVLMKHLHNILKNGIENSAVLNLDTGNVTGKSGTFIIDAELLPKLSFIKEGEFSEKGGAPTLKLIGDIQASANVVAVKKEDILELYPYSWRELIAAVKKELPAVTHNQINDLIKAEKLKYNIDLSAPNFRNKQQAEDFRKTRRLKANIPILYNTAAIEFVIEKLTALP